MSAGSRGGALGPPSPGNISRAKDLTHPCNGGEQQPRRAHRTVVLPEWQGLGIGSRLSDAVAEVHRLEGRAYYGQTVHPSFGRYRDASPLWQPTAWNHTTQHYRIESWRQRLADVRIRLRNPKFTFSHVYVGPGGDAEKQAHLAARVRVCGLAARRCGGGGGGGLSPSMAADAPQARTSESHAGK